jgi:tetratricopeptide (TPR) repeat protein
MPPTQSATEALRQLEHRLSARPDDPILLMQKAHCLLSLGEEQRAMEIANGVRAQSALNHAALEGLGAFFFRAGRQDLALGCYDQVLAMDPQNRGALFNRATLRRFAGNLEGAETDYDALLRSNPQDHEARHNRSELRVQTPERNHVADLEAALRRPFADWRGEVQTHYALAKEYEDLGDFPRSWFHLSAGATLRRRHLNYSVARDVETVDWICESFPCADPQSDGYPNAAPIFVIGLPRSGTTLVERILSSHSAVAPGGELEHFTSSLLEGVRALQIGRPPARREFIEQAARVDFHALGRRYSQKTRALSALRPRFTDKLPLNYLYAGLIHRALPQARIVHVTRHPLALSHAMYKTLFRQGYPFSYDLNEIGQYYAGYYRLMQHWGGALPGVIHEVNYERLIADQGGETRRLLAFCGLEWEERCLAFERNPTATATASASQVRRPLYDSSVALWTHYASELAELRAQLEAAGVVIP